MEILIVIRAIFMAILIGVVVLMGYDLLFNNDIPSEPHVCPQVDTILVINDTCTGVIKWDGKNK